MSIKYNKFGEVISVNGLTTGHHLGKPMQDAAAKKPEDNDKYSVEMNTVSRINTENDEFEASGDAQSDLNQIDTTASDYVKNRHTLQSDWEAFDPSMFGYIQNRTHYVEYTIDADSYEENALTAGVKYKCNSKFDKNGIKAGAIFFAAVDGELVLKRAIDDRDDFASAINDVFKMIGTSATYKPFQMDRKTGKYVTYVTFVPNRDCTIRYGYAYPSGVKKLDPKFIPKITIVQDGYDDATMGVMATITEAYTCTANATFLDVMQMLMTKTLPPVELYAHEEGRLRHYYGGEVTLKTGDSEPYLSICFFTAGDYDTGYKGVTWYYGDDIVVGDY